MTRSRRFPVAILCDFDGTITPIDISDLIFRKFAACGLYYSEQWLKGLIGTREEIVSTFATVSAGKKEIEAALVAIPIDETFTELIAFARVAGIELAIVSDGLDWPIEVVLREHGIQGVRVFSNHVVFDGEKLGFEFPWYDPSTPHYGVCKPLIIQSYHAKGYKVIFIGDGQSDQAAVSEADLVFAKDGLADYCRNTGIEALTYTNFTDVCSQIAYWLAKNNKNGLVVNLPPVQ